MSNFRNRLEFEFQAVILAGGRGSRISQLLHGRPKCLLPIANKPMIQYPLELLNRNHIREAIIVVLDNEEEPIKSSVNRLGLDIQLEFVTIPDSDDYGTADSLRHIKNKLKRDILLISCDLITDLNLNRMIELYRLKNASFLCLFSSMTSERENVVPANNLDNNKEFDYIGLDADDPNRLVFFEPDVMYTESIPLKRSLLRWCCNFTLHSGLKDAHVYMFRNWILDYLHYKVDIRSIKLDLLPSFVRKQFRPIKKSESINYDMEQSVQKDVKRIFDFINMSPMECYLAKIDLQDSQQNHYPESISCAALIVESGYCIRANNLPGFCEANRVLVEQQRSCNYRGSTIGEKSVIKRSVIGNNCKIGKHVTLTNCILQNNVCIENGSHLVNSLVCADVHIGEKTHLENCIVGPRQKVPEHGRYKNESLIEEILDF